MLLLHKYLLDSLTGAIELSPIIILHNSYSLVQTSSLAGTESENVSLNLR